MIPQITIREKACRGCQLCVDICPTKVLLYDEKSCTVSVGEAEDCIACLSCAYICPSKAFTHENFHVVKNFYRDLDFLSRTGRFL